MDQTKLTERQKTILGFLHDYTQERGYSPSIRDIGRAAGISSTSVVNYNLKKLEDAGYLARDPAVARAVHLVDSDGNPDSGDHVRVPLAGYIFASNPVMVSDTAQTASDEVVELARGMVQDTGDLFALRVKGDSMIDALVNEGDIVVLKKTDRAENGQMVAVWLTDRNETTLKRFYREGKRVRLQPANPKMQPIMVNPAQVQIQGKVVLVVRQMA